jgi:hypothetical protein
MQRKDYFRGQGDFDTIHQDKPSFAPVVPIEVARAMEEHKPGSIGNYHLLLAHDVLERPDDYAEVYGNKDYTILMDNSLVELGYPLPLYDVLAACKIVGAQYAILPDVLGDYEGTVERTEAALTEWNNLSDEERGDVQLMPVIQGNSHREHINFLCRFAGRMDVAGFCVPRVIADRQGSRKHIIAEATKFTRVHLLGFSNNLWDDIACARMPNVAGIDSAVPVRLGLKGHIMSFDTPQDPGLRGFYWDNPFEHCTTSKILHLTRDDYLQDVVRNVEIFRFAITA